VKMVDFNSTSPEEPFLYTDRALPHERRRFNNIPTETFTFAVPTSIEALSCMKRFYVAEYIFRQRLLARIAPGSGVHVVDNDLIWIFTHLSSISSDTFGVILQHNPHVCLYTPTSSKWIKYFAPAFPARIFDNVVETSSGVCFSWPPSKRFREAPLSRAEKNELLRNLGLSADSIKLLETKQRSSLMIRCINPTHVDTHPSTCLYPSLYAYCFKCKERFTPRQIYLKTLDVEGL
jgi:hypothetical protein